MPWKGRYASSTTPLTSEPRFRFRNCFYTIEAVPELILKPPRNSQDTYYLYIYIYLYIYSPSGPFKQPEVWQSLLWAWKSWGCYSACWNSRMVSVLGWARRLGAFEQQRGRLPSGLGWRPHHTCTCQYVFPNISLYYTNIYVCNNMHMLCIH